MIAPPRFAPQRQSRRGILAGAGIILAGGLAIAGAWLLLRPSETEVLQAAVSAQDYRFARNHASIEAGETPGALALAVRARLGAGDIDGALALIDRQRANGTDALALRRLRATILREVGLRDAGRLPALQAELDAIARTTGAPADVRALLVVATERGDGMTERAVLLALVKADRATVAEVERLAAIEQKAGRADAARGLLNAALDAGRPLSAAGAESLLALTRATGTPAEILLATAKVARAEHRTPSASELVDQLIAGGRGDVALGVAEIFARATRPLALLRQRVELLRKAGRGGEARALLDRAIAAPPGTIAPGEIVRVAYELDAIDAVFAAIAAGRITRLPPHLALDLAHRAAKAGRFANIAQIDRVVAADWRAGDPWFAMELALRAKDVPGALRYARMLDAKASAGAQEAILRGAGDRNGLRALLLARAAGRSTADRAAIADGLLAEGFKSDSEAMLLRAASRAAPDSREVARLLYLWGPRPDAPALAWLRGRAEREDGAARRLAWLGLYAQRAAPAEALATLGARSDADTAAMLLLRLETAGAAGMSDAQGPLIDRLLDGRTLTTAELARLGALMPASAGAARRMALARASVAAGTGAPQMRLDLAWDAFNRRRLAEAREALDGYLDERPRDPAALALMGEIEKAEGRPKAAKDWFARALAALPPGEGANAQRLQLLEALGRPGEALATVENLRRARPDDRSLLATHARLLIVTGKPAAAQKLLEARGS